MRPAPFALLVLASCASAGRVENNPRAEAPPPQASAAPAGGVADASASPPHAATQPPPSFSRFTGVHFLAGDLLVLAGPGPATWTVLEARTGKPVREIDFEPREALSGGTVLFGYSFRAAGQTAIWLPTRGAGDRVERVLPWLDGLGGQTMHALATTTRVMAVELEGPTAHATRVELRDGTGTPAPLDGFVGPVSQITFSPDERTVAVASATNLGLWEVPSGKALASFKLRRSDVAFSPDGAWLHVTYAAGPTGNASSVVVIDVARRTLGPAFRGGARVSQARFTSAAMRFSPDSHLFAVQTPDGRGTTVVSLPDFTTVRHVSRRMPTCAELPCDPGTKAHDAADDMVDAAILTNDGHCIETRNVSVGDHSVSVLLRDGAPQVLGGDPGRAGPPMAIYFLSGDGSHVVLGDGGPLRLYRVDAAAPPTEIGPPPGALIEDDGRTLFAVPGRQRLTVYEIQGDRVAKLWQMDAAPETTP